VVRRARTFTLVGSRCTRARIAFYAPRCRTCRAFGFLVAVLHARFTHTVAFPSHGLPAFTTVPVLRAFGSGSVTFAVVPFSAHACTQFVPPHPLPPGSLGYRLPLPYTLAFPLVLAYAVVTHAVGSYGLLLRITPFTFWFLPTWFLDIGYWFLGLRLPLHFGCWVYYIRLPCLYSRGAPGLRHTLRFTFGCTRAFIYGSHGSPITGLPLYTPLPHSPFYAPRCLLRFTTTRARLPFYTAFALYTSWFFFHADCLVLRSHWLLPFTARIHHTRWLRLVPHGLRAYAVLYTVLAVLGYVHTGGSSRGYAVTQHAGCATPRTVVTFMPLHGFTFVCTVGSGCWFYACMVRLPHSAFTARIAFRARYRYTCPHLRFPFAQHMPLLVGHTLPLPRDTRTLYTLLLVASCARTSRAIGSLSPLPPGSVLPVISSGSNWFILVVAHRLRVRTVFWDIAAVPPSFYLTCGHVYRFIPYPFCGCRSTTFLHTLHALVVAGLRWLPYVGFTPLRLPPDYAWVPFTV